MRTRHKLFLLFLLFVLAVVCAVYALSPLVHRARMNESVAENTGSFYETTIEIFEEHRETNEIPYLELLRDIQNYNTTLCTTGQEKLTNRQAYEEAPFILSDYGLESEVFGVINIPAINVELPLYLGASEENMANGAAILSQTSIPIGGRNTNAVIAGHRGWYGYKYFSDIELLELGDEVKITNLWRTITYVVTDIKIVSPDDVDSVLIQPGKEMITLLTCHPPNTGGRYRYLVFCERKD